MNKRIYHLFTLLSFLTVLYILWCFSLRMRKESFIPRVAKEAYRPIARNMRMTYEGFYDKNSADISNLFRKIGLL